MVLAGLCRCQGRGEEVVFVRRNDRARRAVDVEPKRRTSGPVLADEGSEVAYADVVPNSKAETLLGSHAAAVWLE